MELSVSSAIIESYFSMLRDSLELDAAIVGAGPSGLVAATRIAQAGYKVGVFEKKLAPGGGMWGGAMLFNRIVVQKGASHILDNFNIHFTPYDDEYVVADSVQATSALIYHATSAGARVFNGVAVEDVVFKNDHVRGVVINWTPVQHLGMHVDPLVIMARCVLDGTGHPCEISSIVARKNGVKLNTPTGEVMFERSLSVDEGEAATVENTMEVYPGLFVSGMAANGVSGSFRMGPIFGGMLRSGEKAAGLMIDAIRKEKGE